tara:strand:+ start:88087 stop:88638 length:552 start_codon:yes stop_codon:yes gene_type:complete
MIGQLRGIIVEKRAPSLILDVNGVGYEIFIPMTIYKDLPETEQETTIKTKIIYKEDSQTIYGFKTYEEKDLFELLISISGIGSKTVLKFLNQYTAKEIKEWIVSEDLKALTQLPGLGNKTARKLLLELSGKLILDETKEEFDNDALSALKELGYEDKAAKSAIKKVMKPKMKTEDIIREVLSQ